MNIGFPLSFFGPLGGPEIIMILVVLFLLAAPVILVLVILAISNRSKSRAALPVTAPPPLPTTQRLTELESLKASGMVSEEEYQEKRKQIVGDL